MTLQNDRSVPAPPPRPFPRELCEHYFVFVFGNLTLGLVFPCFRKRLQCPAAVTSKELRLTRSHFLGLVRDSNRITREEFLAIPCELPV